MGEAMNFIIESVEDVAIMAVCYFIAFYIGRKITFSQQSSFGQIRWLINGALLCGIISTMFKAVKVSLSPKFITGTAGYLLGAFVGKCAVSYLDEKTDLVKDDAEYTALDGSTYDMSGMISILISIAPWCLLLGASSFVHNQTMGILVAICMYIAYFGLVHGGMGRTFTKWQGVMILFGFFAILLLGDMVFYLVDPTRDPNNMIFSIIYMFILSFDIMLLMKSCFGKNYECVMFAIGIYIFMLFANL